MIALNIDQCVIEEEKTPAKNKVDPQDLESAKAPSPL